jgi:glycosyltransferase involved in cell wall biosynthesis
MRKKVLIVYDLPDWILGTIAINLKQFLGYPLEVKIIAAHSEGFKQKLLVLQLWCDVIHFLSPWDFFNHKSLLYKPCCVMLWHMANWNCFDRDCTRIDALMTGSAQWQHLITSNSSWNRNVTRVPYGVEHNKFRPISGARRDFLTSHSLSDNTIVIGFAASAWSNEEGRKGVDRLWASLREAITILKLPVTLRLIGRHWTPELVPNDLQKNVIVELDYPQAELPNYYSSLDVYFCPSHMEGVPYPVVEAMSCESIPISTPVGIVPELIDNVKNGYLLSSDFKPSEFAAILTRAVSDPINRKAIQKAARESVAKSMAWERLDYSLYNNVYKEAIETFQRRYFLDRISFALNAASEAVNIAYLSLRVWARKLSLSIFRRLKRKAF